MPHKATNLLVHFIFSTKQRCALIKPDFEKDLHAYLGGIIRQASLFASMELVITYIFWFEFRPTTPLPTWLV